MPNGYRAALLGYISTTHTGSVILSVLVPLLVKHLSNEVKTLRSLRSSLYPDAKRGLRKHTYFIYLILDILSVILSLVVAHGEERTHRMVIYLS